MAQYNLRFLSKALLRKVEVNVVIPSLNLHQALAEKNHRYYRETTKKYPLFILLSGFSDDNEAFLQKGNIQELCDEYQIAVALLSGDNKWYRNGSAIDNWPALINEELQDFLYGTFRQLDEKLPLFLGGVSMGGYGALYNGLNNIEKYTGLIALSPGLKPDGIRQEEPHETIQHLILKNKNNLPLLYLSVGTDDFIVEHIRTFDEWLKAENIPANFKFVDGYDHSWHLWRIELVEVLKTFRNKGVI